MSRWTRKALDITQWIYLVKLVDPRQGLLCKTQYRKTKYKNKRSIFLNSSQSSTVKQLVYRTKANRQ